MCQHGNRSVPAGCQRPHDQDDRIRNKVQDVTAGAMCLGCDHIDGCVLMTRWPWAGNHDRILEKQACHLVCPGSGDSEYSGQGSAQHADCDAPQSRWLPDSETAYPARPNFLHSGYSSVLRCIFQIKPRRPSRTARPLLENGQMKMYFFKRVCSCWTDHSCLIGGPQNRPAGSSGTPRWRASWRS